MHKRVVTRFLFCLIGFAPAEAQERDAIPRELVDALLGNMLGMSSDIRVGSAPLGFPSKLATDPFLVLGSMVRDNTGTTILTSLLTPDSASAHAVARLLADGFTRRPTGATLSGGFHPPSSPSRQGEPVLLCRGNEVVYLVALARRSAAPGSLLAVNIQRGVPGTCAALPQAAMQAYEPIPIPDLRLPDDATDFQGGGTSGSRDGRSMSATFTTKLASRALTEHFAVQLARQGWVRGTVIVDEGLSASRYTKKSGKGESFSGVLLLQGTSSRRALFEASLAEVGRR